MRLDTGDYNTFICDGPNCGEEIYDAPIMIEGRHDQHFCSYNCALRYTHRPTLASVNGVSVLP